MPLTETFEGTEGYDYGDATEQATALWRVDGEVYAYPFSTSPFGIFVNNDLIAAAGAQSPAEMVAAGTWTWDAALVTAAAVAGNGAEGLIPRDFNYQNWQILAPIFNGWGAAPWSADGATCTMNAPEMAAAMTAVHDAIFVTGAIPGPGEAPDFFTGDAAMTITQISRAPLLAEDGFDWDLVPLPSGTAGDHAVIGQAAIGVFQTGANPQVAADFLAFMSNPENSARLAQFFPPARESLLNLDTLAPINPRLTPEQIEAVVINGNSTGSVIRGHTNFAEVQQTVRASRDALWREDADVEAVLNDTCDALAGLL